MGQRTATLSAAKGDRMRAIWGALAASVALIASATGAADDAMATYYGATLVRANESTDTRTWYDKDGTMKRFRYEKTGNAGGFTVSGQEGRYRLADGKICETIDSAGQETCTDFTPRKIGDSWDTTESGVVNRYRLVRGRSSR